MINPQWLQTYKAVVEHGNFTRAAEHLDLTQAAVSQHVQRLEARLGLLLIRHPRRIELTPAGAALLDYCHDVQMAHRRLAARLDDSDHRHGEVGLITPGSVGLALYPSLLDLQQANRNLIIRHRFAPDPETVDAVLGKQYELGVVTLKPDDPRIRAERLAREPLELVTPAGEHVEHWSDLERLGFIDHPDGQAMATRLLARHFPGNPGVHGLPIRGFSNQISLILEPVARGLGFTVIPRYARQAFAGTDAIQVVEHGAAVVDTLWLIYRAEWPLSARAKFVAGHLRKQMRLLNQR